MSPWIKATLHIWLFIGISALISWIFDFSDLESLALIVGFLIGSFGVEIYKIKEKLNV